MYCSSVSQSREACVTGKLNLNLPRGLTSSLGSYRDSAAWCPYCERVWLQVRLQTPADTQAIYV